MMRSLLTVGLCCLLGLCVFAASAARPPVVLVLGDSLSAGHGIALERAWPSLLQQRLTSLQYPHRVVNASISGETTAGGLARLPELLGQHTPATVVIELGANDGLRGLPLEEVRANLEGLVALSLGHGAKAVVLRMELPPNYGPAYARGFRALYDALETGPAEVTVAPFFLRDVALEPGLMQADGLHPTAAAQSRMLEAVWPTIEATLAAPDPHT